MKCPKCSYLGFETGDRCKNCGYDFSLLAIAEEEVAATAVSGATLELSPPLGDTWSGSASGAVMSGPAFDRFRDLPEPDGPAMTLAGPAFLDEDPPPARSAVPVASTLAVASPMPLSADVPALPLFAPDAVDDEPLVKLPVAPRPPLAVRRTPETPKLRPTAFHRLIVDSFRSI